MKSSTVWLIVLALLIAGCVAPAPVTVVPVATPEPMWWDVDVAIATAEGDAGSSDSLVVGQGAEAAFANGFMTTPEELQSIVSLAARNVEPHRSAVLEVLDWANQDWNYPIASLVSCRNADHPEWNDNEEGIPILYAKALAYHLTGDEIYAIEVTNILERIMTEVERIDLEEAQCRLNFGWSTPELVASAYLIEGHWHNLQCTGPASTVYGDTTMTTGRCRTLFQNWLVKNPYYVISYTAVDAQSNWGAAATNATAHIAAYLLDRTDVTLIHRFPEEINGGETISLSPLKAYHYANALAINRSNGYNVEYMSVESCDYLTGDQQDPNFAPVKSQIAENGILPEDARREESCNIPEYDGAYQNYPQLFLGNLIQQCELMLRRGDSSCYDNIDNTDIPDYEFVDKSGTARTTHLRPGRGSIVRAIDAIIVDSATEWRHDSALAVAYSYYRDQHTPEQVEAWYYEIDRIGECAQDICFGMLTHSIWSDE